VNLAAAVVTLGVAAGPVLAGDAVMWGENARNGAVRVMLARPGAEPVLVHRVRPTTASRTRRRVIDLKASAQRFTAFLMTSTWTHRKGERPSVAIAYAALDAPFGGPAALIAGSLPERVGDSCEGEDVDRYIDGLDVDGDRVALAEVAFSCPRGPFVNTVTVHAGGATTALPVETDGGIEDVALAGRFVAWVTFGSGRRELTVYDLAAGTTVLRVRSPVIDEIELQDDGTVAMVYRGGLGWARPGTPGIRRLDRRPGFAIALSGGRVLYERITSAVPWRSTLRLRALAGGASRRLDSFTDRRPRVRGLDLDADRATWAVRPRGRPARIIVREL
jgi:hypothetical protein